MTRVITDYEHYLTVIARDTCLIKFTANWCQPCKTIEPVLIDLVNKYSEVFNYYVIDFDSAEAKIREHEKVTGIPFFVFYHQNQRVQHIMGANSSELTLAVDRFVNNIRNPTFINGIVVPPVGTKLLDMSKLAADNHSDESSSISEEIISDVDSDDELVDEIIEKTVLFL